MGGASTDDWHNLVELKLAAITEIDTLCRLVYQTVRAVAAHPPRAVLGGAR
jgi:hypothetical protein